MAERAAESIPGLAVATKLEAIQNFRKSNAGYRRRINDSHKWQAEAIGMKASDAPEEEDMGNLIVTGDVYGSDASEIIKSLQGIDSTVQEQKTTPSKKLLGAAIIAASLLCSGGLGAGIPWLLGAYNKSNETTVINQDAEDSSLGIEVVKGGAR